MRRGALSVAHGLLFFGSAVITAVTAGLRREPEPLGPFERVAWLQFDLPMMRRAAILQWCAAHAAMMPAFVHVPRPKSTETAATPPGSNTA